MKTCFILLALVVVVAAQRGGPPRPRPPGRRSSEDSSNSRDRSRENHQQNNDGRNNLLQISFNGGSSIRGFSCSTAASFTTTIDGTRTTARCTDTGADPAVRCPGCCRSVALAAGRSADNAAGFPSTNGRSCVCCIR